MSQRRPNVSHSLQRCCPAHTTDAITEHLKNKWLHDARSSSVNGKVDAIAVIMAAELVKLSMIRVMELGYAAQGSEAVERFHADLTEALRRIQPISGEGTS